MSDNPPIKVILSVRVKHNYLYYNINFWNLQENFEKKLKKFKKRSKTVKVSLLLIILKSV